RQQTAIDTHEEEEESFYPTDPARLDFSFFLPSAFGDDHLIPTCRTTWVIFVDLYVPRKCSASNRIISAKDHASIQINIAELDPITGRFGGQFKTYAICGAFREDVFSFGSFLLYPSCPSRASSPVPIPPYTHCLSAFCFGLWLCCWCSPLSAIPFVLLHPDPFIVLVLALLRALTVSKK
uniref:Small ribosomal subunit protein eS21 n=1 Tax=Eptatretus burgeri TaxID=7764 RepID=A0A8C4N6P1_EPTBU